MNEEPLCVIIRDEGFRLLLGESSQFEIFWDQVLEIVAFKEDCFGCDEICIGFRRDESDEYFRVMEASHNYGMLLEELPRRFPGIREDWHDEVAFPAFVPNWTRLWQRSQ